MYYGIEVSNKRNDEYMKKCKGGKLWKAMKRKKRSQSATKPRETVEHFPNTWWTTSQIISQILPQPRLWNLRHHPPSPSTLRHHLFLYIYATLPRFPMQIPTPHLPPWTATNLSALHAPSRPGPTSPRPPPLVLEPPATAAEFRRRWSRRRRLPMGFGAKLRSWTGRWTTRLASSGFIRCRAFSLCRCCFSWAWSTLSGWCHRRRRRSIWGSSPPSGSTEFSLRAPISILFWPDSTRCGLVHRFMQYSWILGFGFWSEFNFELHLIWFWVNRCLWGCKPHI